MSLLTWSAASGSDRGRVREQNEDAFCEVPEAGLFAVADGMGGHAAGEVASGIAVDTLRERLGGRDVAGLRSPDDGRADGPRRSGDGDDDGNAGDGAAGGDGARESRLAEAVREANARILRDAERNPSRSGMGTTLTALLLGPDAAWRVAHVGDSRAYLLRGGELRPLTRDHTWVAEEVTEGRLTREEARVHPMSSVLNRALGTDPDVAADVERGRAAPDDVYLLATDGLTDMIPEDRLAGLLREAEDPSAAVHRLIDAANRAGGRDNVTAVVVRLEEAGS